MLQTRFLLNFSLRSRILPVSNNSPGFTKLPSLRRRGARRAGWFSTQRLFRIGRNDSAVMHPPFKVLSNLVEHPRICLKYDFVLKAKDPYSVRLNIVSS